MLQISSPQSGALEAILSQSAFIEDSLSKSDISRWEFEMNGTSDIATQIYAPDWGDMMVDNLSCRLPPTNNTSPVVQSHDPYEADLPLPLSLACLTLGDTFFVASQHPPLPAPVFRAYRPPSLTA